MTAVAERDQILQVLFAVTVLIGTPIVAVTLVIRGIFNRRRAVAQWRDCAVRNGWSEGPGGALMSGLNQGLAWTLGVEGSDDDEIVWRAGVMPDGAMLDVARLASVAEIAHAGLSTPTRARLPLSDIAFDGDTAGLSLHLRNRDLSCSDAEAVIALGLSVARGLALEGRP